MSLGHIWREMPFMRGETGRDRLVELRAITQEQATKCRERRARVLRHGWARERLCSILAINEAEKWNGWVAPKMLPEDSDGKGDEKHGAGGGYRPNDAASRRSLIELLREVDAYERTQSAAE